MLTIDAFDQILQAAIISTIPPFFLYGCLLLHNLWIEIQRWGRRLSPRQTPKQANKKENLEKKIYMHHGLRWVLELNMVLSWMNVGSCPVHSGDIPGYVCSQKSLLTGFRELGAHGLMGYRGTNQDWPPAR